MKKRVFCLALIFSCTLIFSCSPQASKVIGKWSEQDKGTTYIFEFFKDNTATFTTIKSSNSPFPNSSVSGKWVALDDGRIKVDITGAWGMTLVMFGRVDGNILVLTMEGDKEGFKLNRVTN